MLQFKDSLPQFNALTDRWLPLLQPDDSVVWGSPVELLSGEKDGCDLDYPRDDFRIFARLLLSALVQALFPAATTDELQMRLAEPLSRAIVEARIAPVVGDFELLGPNPFLQVAKLPGSSGTGAVPFVFPQDDWCQPSVLIDALALPIALVMLFAEQVFAGAAGLGYGPGPARQLGALTLIDPGSIRQGAWANTLAEESARRRYPRCVERPWSNELRAERPRASIGLAEGLFFQPRSIVLRPAGEGRCSFSGLHGPLVRRSPLFGKSKLTKKRVGDDDVWQHPCAPLAVNSLELAAIRVRPDRPLWAALPQLVSPRSRCSAPVPWRQGPAPVLEQWHSLGVVGRRSRLLVLDFLRDKAKVRARFFGSYPLNECVFAARDHAKSVRGTIEDAEEVGFALRRAVASSSGRTSPVPASDVERDYWMTIEPSVLAWLERTSDSDATLSAAEAPALRVLVRDVAMRSFAKHVAGLAGSARSHEAVARAGRGLLASLYASVPRSDDAAGSR